MGAFALVVIWAGAVRLPVAAMKQFAAMVDGAPLGVERGSSGVAWWGAFGASLVGVGLRLVAGVGAGFGERAFGGRPNGVDFVGREPGEVVGALAVAFTAEASDETVAELGLDGGTVGVVVVVVWVVRFGVVIFGEVGEELGESGGCEQGVVPEILGFGVDGCEGGVIVFALVSEGV